MSGMDAAADTIPERLNSTLSMLIISLAIALLWLGAHSNLPVMLLCAVLYSFLLLTNSALIHEACHDTLRSDNDSNYRSGVVLSRLFPTSFAVLRITHIVHHCCNRTDHEMFDRYYAGDKRLVKRIQWYGLLLGLWWLFIPLGNILLALVPRVLYSKPFRRARSTVVLFNKFGKSELSRVRREVFGSVICCIALAFALDISALMLLAFYACFAVNWSTRQYATHAFTARDVRNGALNLTVGPLMAKILLNGDWDLVHHQHPHLPWFHLPTYGAHSSAPVSYWAQYRRMWRGPKRCDSPGPPIRSRLDYEGLQP